MSESFYAIIHWARNSISLWNIYGSVMVFLPVSSHLTRVRKGILHPNCTPLSNSCFTSYKELAKAALLVRNYLRS
ncbi:hypothetical protein ACTXT7_008986 [Hymenolepis weldensis]